MKTYRRRNYIINKRLQSRFVLGFSVAVLAGFLLNLLFVYFLIDRELNQELYKIHLKIRTTSEIALPVLVKLGAITIPSILVISAVIGYFLTRRIELPLERFRDAVKKASHGDFTQDLSKDIPGGLGAAFNRMSGSLGGVFGSVKKIAGDLEQGFDGLNTAGKPQRADLGRALDKIADARVSISREISKLKV